MKGCTIKEKIILLEEGKATSLNKEMKLKSFYWYYFLIQ
jgi:hypothetical protein